MSRRAAAWALALACLGAVPARADEARGGEVALAFEGAEEHRVAFSASLAELLSRLGLGLAAAGAPGSLATVAVDWTSPSEGVLTVSEPSGRVVLLRRLPRTEKPAVGLEAAAHIAQAVVEELREQARRKPFKVAQSQAPGAPGDAPVAALEASSAGDGRAEQGRVALDVGAFVAGRLFGGDAPVAFGFGLTTAVALGTVRFRPALWLHVGYHAPFENSNDWAQLTTHALAFRLVPKAGLFGGDNWRLDAGLGGGADLFISRVRSSVLPPQLLGPPRADAAPILTALVAGHLGVARSADLSLSFTLDVDLAPRRFVVNVGGSPEELFNPWRVRPALLLGFSLSPVGPDPYRGRGEEAR